MSGDDTDTRPAAERNRLDRRGLLGSLGAAGALTLAGCSGGTTDRPGGDDGSGNGNEDGTGNASGDGEAGPNSGGKLVDPEFTGFTMTVPANNQYNPYNRKAFAGEAASLLWDPLAVFNEKTREWTPLIAEEWSFGAEKATVTLRESYAWSNGDPVTAADLVTPVRIDQHFGTGLWDFLETVEATGDRTVEFRFTEATNPELPKGYVLSYRLDKPDSVYREYRERLAEAGSEEERKPILSDLQSFGPSEPPATNGPFAFESANKQRVTLKRFPDYDNGHVTADDLFPTFVLKSATGSKKQVMLNQGAIDGWRLTMPKEVKQKLPDHVGGTKKPIYNGLGLAFNFEREPYDDPRVRRAFAHLLPRRQIQQNNSMAYLKDPHRYASGLDPTLVDEWLGDFTDDLTEYAWTEQNPETAASLLREAGFQKEDGTWVDGDGQALEAPIKVRVTAAEWVTEVQFMASLLSNFGIEANMVTRSGTSFATEFLNGEFVLAGNWWGGWSSTGHPYFMYRNLYDFTEPIEGGNLPTEVEVPWPPGEADGETKTIDVGAKTTELAHATETEEARRLVRELAWTYNQNVPRYPIQTHNQTYWYTTDDWNVPETFVDDPKMQTLKPTRTWLRLGGITGKTG
jgi:peptide/nickel transport system substrate-binding protein